MGERIVVVAGPRCGKSTLARQYREQGLPTFCGDPESQVKEPEQGVTYAPEGLGMGPASSAHVVDHWFTMPGPWVCEGHIMARALRKWQDRAEPFRAAAPCDKIIVLKDHHPCADVTRKQEAMHTGVMTTWRDIQHEWPEITWYGSWVYDWDGSGKWHMELDKR